jgi:hypothetical protein
MSRPLGLNKTVAFRIADDSYKAIEAAMAHERRTESDVCRALLVRGLAAYKRDGRLFESEDRKVANWRGKR